jgi:NADH:ubiquinone reductase (H+-translocating)
LSGEAVTAEPSAPVRQRGRPRVVIVGGGFGGLYAARALKRDDVEVLLLDRTNHHLFQPLLYQVATATLAPSDITAPIRWLLRKQRNATVLMEEVAHVDTARRVVATTSGREHAYDYLILATGSRHAYFSHPEWEKLAPGLKSIDDAIELRQRILTAFERAETIEDAEERAAWLTFVVVGGGPTGTELAGMLPTIARHALGHDFRRIDPASARVILVEGGPKILPSYPDELSEHAQRDLANLGVDVRTGTLVSEIGEHHVVAGGERIHAHTILWAAGNAASPLGRDLHAKLDRAGRVEVEPDLSVSGHPEVFVIGDLAATTTNGKAVPGVAPAAMQMGARAAKNIRRDLEHRERVSFRYRNKGDLATIGRYRAIADFGRLRVTGSLAWWFWLFLHIMYLAGFRNRVSVLVEWAYSYFTYERGARLITRRGALEASREEPIPGKW